MAQARTNQNWLSAMVLSGAAVFIAVTDSFSTPSPEEPDWLQWVWFGLSAAMFGLLLIALLRVTRLVADHPQRRGLTIVVLLVGLAAALYSLAQDISAI